MAVTDSSDRDAVRGPHRWENGDPITIYGLWEQKAEENIEEWGEQDLDTLLLAMQEELGELTQAYLEHRAEDGDFEEMGRELDDLVPLCIQFRRALIREHEGGGAGD